MTNSYLKILKDFCDEYVRLAEGIIFWDKEYMDMLDELENKVASDRILGKMEGLARLSPRECQLHFMKLRVENIKKAFAYSGVLNNQKKLTQLVAAHPYEKKELQLSYKVGQLLTPTQIYANYYVIVERLNVIDKTLEAYAEKKK